MTEPKLDILVLDSHDFFRLVVGDISTYPTGFGILSPQLTITPPGFNSKTATFTSKSMNIFDSDDLGITCTTDNSCLLSELPDGIWKIKYTIYPATTYHVDRTFLRVDQLKRRLSEAFLKAEFTECSSEIQDSTFRSLNEIIYYIDAAVAAANECNNKLALSLYKSASKMLDDFINSKCYGLR